MPECAKTQLQQSRISQFSGEDPDPPVQGEGREGKGWGAEGGDSEGKEGGTDREGRGGTERDRGGKEGGRGGMGEGRGGEGRSTWAPPIETRSGSALADCHVRTLRCAVLPLQPLFRC